MTPEIDIHEAKKRIAAGAVLVDVREQNEWDEKHIPNAQLVPLSELETGYSAIPKDKDIIVQCRSGARSARATDFLLQEGYNAVNMAGGILAWEEADYPTEEGA